MPDTDYTQDKAFMAASPADQHAYLMSVDAGYAKASKEDQGAYLNSLMASSRLARSAQPTTIEKEQIGKGFITPEREKELIGAVRGGASPSIIPLEKYGVTLPHLASEGWEGLKDIGRSVKSLAKDISSSRPLMFGGGETPETESTFHKYVIAPGERESEKAATAKTPVESIGHSVAAALPVLGPAVASLAEQAGGGDIGGAIGRGAGQAAGAKLLSKVPDVLPKLDVNAVEMGRGLATGDIGAGVKVKTPKIVESARQFTGKKLSPAQAEAKPAAAEFQPALGNTAREVLEHAAKEGIDLTPGQATNMPTARMLQAIGERSLFGSEKLAEGIDKNAGAFMKATRNFADRMDPKAAGLSEESAGEAIRQATETGKSVTHENASLGYKKIDHLMPEKIDPTSISEKWHELRERLPMGAEEMIRAQMPRNMSAIVEDLLSGKPEGFKPTFEQGIALRSFFRELGETEGLPGRSEAAFKTMSKVVDSAMESTAKKMNSAGDWREANQGWKDYNEKYGDRQSPLVRILKQADPAKITRDLLNRASAKDIEILQKEKLDAAIEPLKRQMIEEIAKNKFTVGRNGLGGFSHSFLNKLFGPEAIKELYLKADIGRRFNWQMNPSGTSNVMMAESQIAHPEPSKLGLLYGAAKTSMPRAAGSYLPDIAPAGTVKPLGLPMPGAPPAPGGRGGEVKFKGGINPKGVEASIKPIETQDMITGLSGEVARMKEKLRNAGNATAKEKLDLKMQIKDYQERLDELREKRP